MNPRVTVITLGVDDLARALRFYRDGLGLPSEGIIGTEFEQGAVVFMDLQPGLKLALWPRKSLAHDSGRPLSRPSPTELSLGHNVGSRAEVDTVMIQAQQAGAVIVKPAQATFWGGYAGYFQDPEATCGKWSSIPSRWRRTDAHQQAVAAAQPSPLLPGGLIALGTTSITSTSTSTTSRRAALPGAAAR